MNKKQIVARLKAEKFPPGSFVVSGSGPMAAAGIREVQDIDIVVSPELHATLIKRGWEFAHRLNDDLILTHDNIEASKSWDFGSYNPTFHELLENATIVDGVPFVNLEDVKKWKVITQRPHDLEDIRLIDEHLGTSELTLDSDAATS